jgi:UDP:flavonoid glycosyltransferase YjiC (YdhE family)
VRVLAACSLGGAGHLRPLLPFVAAAQRAGHEARVIGPAGLADMARAVGVEFVVGSEPPESDIAPIREQLPVAPRAEASILGNRELFGRMATTAMLPDMHAVIDGFAPDLLLRDPCEYASAVVAAERGLRSATVAISLAEVEWGATIVASPALEAHHAGLTDAVVAAPYITRLPATLDPSQFPTTIRCRETDLRAPQPLPDWWAGRDGPLVYVTFGTVLAHMTIARSVFRAAIDALADVDARLLLTTGRAFDPSELGGVPDHVHVEQWVEQADVLAACDAVVTHGGSGTVYGALGAGRPLVVVPLFADQFENARIAEGAGAAIVTAYGDGAMPGLRLAVERLLHEATFGTAARGIAAEVASAPTVDDVLTSLL